MNQKDKSAFRNSAGPRLAICAVAVGLVVAGCSGTPEKAEASVPQGKSAWELQVTPIDVDNARPEAVEQDGALVVLGSVADKSGVDENETLNVFDVSSGKRLWGVDGKPQQVWVASDAIVVRQADAVVVYDAKTGEPRFEEPVAEDRRGMVSATDEHVMILGPDKSDKRTVDVFGLESGDRVQDMQVAGGDDVTVSSPQERSEFFGVQHESQHTLMRSTTETQLVHVYQDAADGKFMTMDIADGETIWELPGDKAGGSPDATLDSTMIGDINIVGPLRNGGCRFGFASLPEGQSSADEATVEGGQCDETDPTVPVHGSYAMGQKEKRPVVVDVANGETVWSADENGQPFLLGDDIAVYAPEGGKSLKAVSVSSGKTLWTQEKVELSPNMFRGQTHGRAISKDHLVSGEVTANKSTVRSAANGDPQWTYEGFPVAQGDGHFVFVSELARTTEPQMVSIVPADG